MLLPPDYLDAVVAIGTETSEGQRHWIGTGFFFVQMTTDALFMVEALENDELVHEAPAIVGC